MIPLIFLLILLQLSLPTGGWGQRYPTRAAVSRVKSDMRNIAIALVDYWEDHRSYPRDSIHDLTTPASYISDFPTDLFHPESQDNTYAYWSPDDLTHYMIWSAGPDFEYDLTAEMISDVFDPDEGLTFEMLIDHLYDATNGSTSSGDIIRIKQ